MGPWLNAYKTAQWIISIGVVPVVFFMISYSVFLIIISSIPGLLGFLEQLLSKSLVAIFGWIVFTAIVYFAIKKQREESYDHIIEISSKFKMGIILVFIGHIGLLAQYLFLAYGLIFASGGSFSGMFLIPFMIWMGFFYLIGFNLISTQIYIAKLKTNKQAIDTKIINNKAQKIEKDFNKTLIFIISAIVLIVSFLIIMNKYTKEGRVVNQYLLECGEDEIVMRKSSQTKVYIGKKEMGRLHQANYYYFGDLKGDKITLNTKNNNLVARAIECIGSTTKFDLVLSDDDFKDSVLNSKNL